MQQPVQQNNPPPPEGLVLVYVGPIQAPGIGKLRSACTTAINQKIKRLTIFLQSNGGSPDEGFATYGLLRSLPVELTMHAIGAIESIAGAVFLAADIRFCTPESHFMFHEFTWGFSAQTSDTRHIAGIKRTLESSERKYTEILQKRTAFSKEDFESLDPFKQVTILTGADAKQKRIVQDVKEAVIPAGWIVHNVEA